MIKQIHFKNKTIEYELKYKNIKNINLRIKPDGTIHVSAGKRVSEDVIENFLHSKELFVEKALNNLKIKSEMPCIRYYSDEEIRIVITEICQKVYPYFEQKGIGYPQIKFRKMVSQWGNCRSQSGIITFNTNLVYVPHECIKYVVLHEFTHLAVPNHSSRFYEELEKVYPDWHTMEKKLKNISLR